MKTVTILIGNSDDKLTQRDWHEFAVELVRLFIDNTLRCIHFSGPSYGDASWQNYCLVAEVEDAEVVKIRSELRTLRDQFNQDSIAMVTGETVFIK